MSVRYQPPRVWTEEDLQALPEDGYLHEVVDGDLVMSPKNDFWHGQICTRLSAALHLHVTQHRLGVVLDSSTGFWMHNRNCRAPDIAFVSTARLRKLGFEPATRRFFPAGPDLAVEVLAPSNTRAEVDERLRDFFASGTQLAWIIRPDDRFVEVCHAPDRREIIGPGGCLTGEPVVPGFQYAITDLFKEWAWE